MRIEPFERVDDVSFAITKDQIIWRMGLPRQRTRNAVELDEMDYGHVVYRFQDTGRLEEVTAHAPVLQMGNVAVPFASLGGFVREHDQQAFECAGFLVSPAFGIAFVPNQPDWVTALARHCLPEWRALAPQT